MDKKGLLAIGKKLGKLNRQVKSVERAFNVTKFTTQLGDEHGILRLYVPVENAKASGLGKGDLVDVLIRKV